MKYKKGIKKIENSVEDYIEDFKRRTGKLEPPPPRKFIGMIQIENSHKILNLISKDLRQLMNVRIDETIGIEFVDFLGFLIPGNEHFIKEGSESKLLINLESKLNEIYKIVYPIMNRKKLNNMYNKFYVGNKVSDEIREEKKKGELTNKVIPLFMEEFREDDGLKYHIAQFLYHYYLKYSRNYSNDGKKIIKYFIELQNKSTYNAKMIYLIARDRFMCQLWYLFESYVERDKELNYYSHFFTYDLFYYEFINENSILMSINRYNYLKEKIRRAYEKEIEMLINKRRISRMNQLKNKVN